MKPTKKLNRPFPLNLCTACSVLVALPGADEAQGFAVLRHGGQDDLAVLWENPAIFNGYPLVSWEKWWFHVI
jgi:hypothetical protein